jgi:hypothetical protein
LFLDMLSWRAAQQMPLSLRALLPSMWLLGNLPPFTKKTLIPSRRTAIPTNKTAKKTTRHMRFTIERTKIGHSIVQTLKFYYFCGNFVGRNPELTIFIGKID